MTDEICPGEPLTAAVEANMTEVAKLLVGRGARVFPRQELHSLLHFAAKNNNPELIKLFLANGYNVDHKVFYRTALAWAARHGSSAAAQVLI